MTDPYKEKGSKFYGVFSKLYSVDSFPAFLSQVKKEYKSAAHYCYAYVFGTYEKTSNDREPGGVSAALLNVLKSSGAENCAVVVARVFGGTKLGVGNLIRAYTTAAKNAVNSNSVGV